MNRRRERGAGDGGRETKTEMRQDETKIDRGKDGDEDEEEDGNGDENEAGCSPDIAGRRPRSSEGRSETRQRHGDGKKGHGIQTKIPQVRYQKRTETKQHPHAPNPLTDDHWHFVAVSSTSQLIVRPPSLWE